MRQQVTVPLRFADGYATTARVITFDGLVDGKEHLALGLGDWQRALTKSAAGGRAPLVRPHSECLTGDVFGSQRCDCGPQLREAVERIAEQGGLLLYLRQEGRGIGLYAKLDAYALQDAGLDTYEANVALGRGEDERDYTAAAQMLLALGADRVRAAEQQPGQGRASSSACGVDGRPSGSRPACTCPRPTCATWPPRPRTPRTPSTCRWPSETPTGYADAGPRGVRATRRPILRS